MKYCSQCGNEIFDDAAICARCGSLQKYREKVKPAKDRMNIFWFIISFLWWWVGLILYFGFKKSNPHKAKVCLRGTISVFVVAAIIGLIALIANIVVGTIHF